MLAEKMSSTHSGAAEQAAQEGAGQGAGARHRGRRWRFGRPGLGGSVYVNAPLFREGEALGGTQESV